MTGPSFLRHIVCLYTSSATFWILYQHCPNLLLTPDWARLNLASPNPTELTVQPLSPTSCLHIRASFR